MAGIPKEPGPTARHVAASIKRIRRAQDVTTAELSRRLTALGQPIPDTSITKTETRTRRVDVDDLTALALALGVTPNTLLMPPVGYLGSSDSRQITPAVSGTAEELWQWAQGERPLRMPVPCSDSWLGDGEHPDLEFSVRCRPYLTALHGPVPGGGGLPASPPRLRELSAAVLAALAGGATAAEVRRVTELTIALPAVMTPEQISRYLKDGTRPSGEGS